MKSSNNCHISVSLDSWNWIFMRSVARKKIWNTRLQIQKIRALLRVFQALPYFYLQDLFYSKSSTKNTNFIDEIILKNAGCASWYMEWGWKLLDCNIVSSLELVLHGCRLLSICLRYCRDGSKGVIASQMNLGFQLTPNEISICRAERGLLHIMARRASTSALPESRPDIRHSLTCACSVFVFHKDCYD